MRIKVGDRVYDKVSQRYGIVKKFVGEDFVGMFYVKPTVPRKANGDFQKILNWQILQKKIAVILIL